MYPVVSGGRDEVHLRSPKIVKINDGTTSALVPYERIASVPAKPGITVNKESVNPRPAAAADFSKERDVPFASGRVLLTEFTMLR